jgi:hypothetical protein
MNKQTEQPESGSDAVITGHTVGLPDALFDRLARIAGGPDKVEAYLQQNITRELDNYVRLISLPENQAVSLLMAIDDKVGKIDARVRHAVIDIQRAIPSDLEGQVNELRGLVATQSQTIQKLAQRQRTTLDILGKLLAAPDNGWVSGS